MNIRILNQTESRISHERILKVQGNHVTQLVKVHRHQNHPYKNQSLKRKNKKLLDVKKKLIEASAFIDVVTSGLKWMVSPLIPMQVALVKSSGPQNKKKGRDHNVEWRN